MNGPSIVLKIRYVASSLLETPPSPPTVDGKEVDDLGLSRSAGYLFEFLNVLGGIEKVRSCAPSWERSERESEMLIGDEAGRDRTLLSRWRICERRGEGRGRLLSW